MIHGLPVEKQESGGLALWRVGRFGHIDVTSTEGRMSICNLLRSATPQSDVPPSIVPPERLAEVDATFDRLHACHDSSRHTTS